MFFVQAFSRDRTKEFEKILCVIKQHLHYSDHALYQKVLLPSIGIF